MMLERVSNWTVEDLGINEDWVYDIEVEDCHNFFANDILVHNSIYLNFEALVNKVIPENTPTQKIVDFLDKFVKKYVAPFIKNEFVEMSKYLNFISNKLSMKREAIADKVIWRGKKNYILQVYDSEGVRYQTPKIKVAGLESVRSAVPKISRKSLVKCYNILLNGTEEELIHYVKGFKQEFIQSPISDIAFPRGVNDIDKWLTSTGWKVGTPIHVKAAISYNNLLRKLNLHTTYSPIKNGDKIRFVYLKEPNLLHSNAIAFVETLHSEFGMDEYVDKSAQYEKTFRSPLESIAKLVGFDTEFRANVNSFFGDDDAVNTVEVKKWGNLDIAPPLKKEVSDIPKTITKVSTPRQRKQQSTLTGFFE